MTVKKTSASKTSGKAKTRAASKKRKVMGTGSPAKKAVAKKAVAKRAAAKKSVAKKAAPRKATVKKATAKKTAVRKAAAKKVPAKKTVARKSAVQKAVAKKTLPKKTLTKKAPAKKTLSAKPVVKPVSKIAASVRTSPATAPRSGASKAPKARAVASKPRTTRPSPPKTSPTRPAAAASRAKPAEGSAAKPISAPCSPTRKAGPPQRPARSAARGVAPMPASAPTAKEAASRSLADESLSEQKLREHVRTAVLYLDAWLRSSGAEATPAVVELAQPAEASRAQVWRWLEKEARFEDDRPMTPELFEAVLNREMELLREDIGAEAYEAGLFVTAAQLFLDLALAPDFEDFPGLPAPRLLD
jgi:hypothetical protein